MPFFLAVFGVLAAYGLDRALKGVSLSVPWWLDAPATMGFFSLFYFGFDWWAWRVPLLHTVGLVKTPRLAGKWKADIASSFGEQGNAHTAEVKITQTWTRMAVVLETERSRSASTVAGIVPDAPGGALLTYEYMNEPKSMAEPTMHMHRGVARLRLANDGRVLDGDYYSGRDRQNHGALRLERM